jgi:hypothetical protein
MLDVIKETCFSVRRWMLDAGNRFYPSLVSNFSKFREWVRAFQPLLIFGQGGGGVIIRTGGGTPGGYAAR